MLIAKKKHERIINAKDAEIFNLKQECRELDDTIIDLNDKVYKLESDLDGARGNIKIKKDIIESKNGRIDRLREEIRSDKLKIKEFKEMNENLISDKGELMVEVKKLNRKVNKITKERDELATKSYMLNDVMVERDNLAKKVFEMQSRIDMIDELKRQMRDKIDIAIGAELHKVKTEHGMVSLVKKEDVQKMLDKSTIKDVIEIFTKLGLM